MTKSRANHIRPGMNDAKAQGKGAGYQEGNGNEPLSAEERQFNKKTKKRQ
ncbi:MULTISPECIES: small acid-soluble spore protein O [Bacillaceae]|uniref:Small acid-soluble spore protein O n=1 Tax=Evansella alkalicola TaxID=745819 RepID=A0ABS6JW62_9BACI|nr:MULTISPECIES: small acid-soluble spore protein O [Bacillaceae]MBU9721365.1 small acid-soluble spore protein O [Bacillus alkalicola]